MRCFVTETNKDRWESNLPKIAPDIRWVITEEGDQLWNAHGKFLAEHFVEIATAKTDALLYLPGPEAGLPDTIAGLQSAPAIAAGTVRRPRDRVQPDRPHSATRTCEYHGPASPDRQPRSNWRRRQRHCGRQERRALCIHPRFHRGWPCVFRRCHPVFPDTVRR